MSIAAAPSAAARAAALLSGWWSRPVEAERAAWEESWPLAGEVAAEIGLDAGRVEQLAACSGGVEVDELLDEYERLFVGPGRTPCSPYESLWLSEQPRLEQGRLMGAASVAIADLYRGLGLDVATSAHELPDHLAIELEALAVALGAEGAAAEETGRVLLHEHLQVWVPRFCALVEAQARHPFYAALARVTGEWVERLARDTLVP